MISFIQELTRTKVQYNTAGDSMFNFQV